MDVKQSNKFEAVPQMVEVMDLSEDSKKAQLEVLMTTKELAVN